MINYSGLIFETSMHVSRHSFTWRIPSEPESIDFWWLYYHFPLSISEGFLIVWLILQPHVISLYSIPKRVPRQWKAFLIATVWRKGQSRARAGKSLHVTGRIIDLETWSGKPEPGIVSIWFHQLFWSTKMFALFRLFLDAKIIAQGQTMILSSKNNQNTENTFVDLTE